MEPHLGEVSQTQMPKIFEMPLMQPYVEQGLGLLLEGDLVVLEDLEEVCLHQSQLHTWFQS